MEKTYTISQISKLLGLTNDAIRFYEKKGLVHSTINPHNSYRMYTLKNVLELLDIIYYRHLDFSIIEIQELYQNLDPTQAYQLVETQKIKVERRILYEQQLLKKINYIQSLYHQIKTDKNIEITTFPTSYILFESKDSDEFFTHKIRHITTDEFVLCSIFKKYDHTLNQQATYVTLETDIASKLQLSLDLQTINLTKCIHMTCAMNNKIINKTTINKLVECAKINNLNYASYFLIKEIPLTFYHDKENYYAEIYLPII